MKEELISVIDIAKEFGKRKQTIFKILRRYRIETQKLPGFESRGQLVSYVTKEDYELLKIEIKQKNKNEVESSQILDTEIGVFYLIQLEPNHDPGRFKLGFASNISERLRSHRCSAPFSILIKTWVCKRLWEKTIDCVTSDCEKLHTEVFRTDSLESLIKKCDAFFSLMPNLANNSE